MFRINKENIVYAIYWVLDKYRGRLLQKPLVKSFDETIELIIKDRLSVSRFGDGEFKIIQGEGIPFQLFGEKLQKRLKEVLVVDNSEILICIPEVFDNLDQYVDYSKRVWTSLLAQNREEWLKFLRLDKAYYNAFLSRPYVIYKDKAPCKERFIKLKQIWNDRDIIFVEGNKSRLGVGNDLFENCHKIERIICPSKNAFESIEKVLNAVCKNNSNKNKLVLLALGPTATVLAYDLCLVGIQTIDIGHVDIEYEWFLRQANGK